MARPRNDQRIDIPARAIAETIRLLDEKDMAAITLAEVAAAIGCRAPALYTHFAGKDALSRAVHDTGFTLLLDQKRALAAQHGDDALARLRAGGRAYLRFALDHPGLYRLMFAPPPTTENTERERGNPFRSDPGARCLDALRAAVRACQDEGYLPGADASLVAFTLWSTVHGAATLVLQARAPVSEGDDAIETAMAAVETVMAFIRATRLPNAAARPPRA